MARWGLGYDVLAAANPGLVMAHVTGFGQTGPMSDQPGFGTLAESMSGFANRNGQPDGPPVLPPFGLADTVTGMTTALAVMSALWGRRLTGRGQEVDVAIIEPLLTVLEPQLVEYDQLGTVMQRLGNRSPVNAPRNMYLAADDRWVAISTSTQSTADRLLRLVGRADILDEPWFRSAKQRAEHADLLDACIAPWVRARKHDDVIAACRAAGAPAALVYTVADVMTDPQYAAIGAVATVDDADLGPVRMAATPFRLSSTPPRIRWAGPTKGAHNAEVYGELGLDAAELQRLADLGAV
jgi:crotonobetainyl-CoA:carnitine CoA-transferase CaiB-like acyl-CoA transferase